MEREREVLEMKTTCDFRFYDCLLEMILCRSKVRKGKEREKNKKIDVVLCSQLMAV